MTRIGRDGYDCAKAQAQIPHHTAPQMSLVSRLTMFVSGWLYNSRGLLLRRAEPVGYARGRLRVPRMFVKSPHRIPVGRDGRKVIARHAVRFVVNGSVAHSRTPNAW